MNTASGSALQMLIRVFVLFCTWPMVCFAGHVLVLFCACFLHCLHAFMLSCLVWVFSLAACSTDGKIQQLAMRCINLKRVHRIQVSMYIAFNVHVLVFVLCEHFCLVSMCSHVYCLDLFTSLLVQLPHLLSLITLLICSLFILLVFVVLCQFIVKCSLVVSWSCPAFSCPTCQIASWVFPPRGSFRCLFWFCFY